MCGCHGRCCKCLPATLLEWSGDRDFTSDLDIRSHAGYFSELTERQPPNTSSLWRIRYAPDEAFLEYLTDTKTLVSGSFLSGSVLIDYFPFDAEAALHSGPVRDGLIYGLDMVPAGEVSQNLYHQPSWVYVDPYAAAVDRSFVGSANLKSYNTNGSSFPTDWTIQDHPDNPVDLPWALEAGCVRCGCSTTITWPSRGFTRYSPWTPYAGLLATDPASSTLATTTVGGCCLSVTGDDKQSIYWPGDEAEPDHEATCPADCIVWVSDMQVTTPAGTVTGGGGRSIPGASLPSDAPAHPALSLASAGGTSIQLEGWAGQVNGSDVIRAARGDAAAIENVDCLWLTNPYYTATVLGPSTISSGLASGDLQWLRDWLALGNKTLILDTPWKHTTLTHGNQPLNESVYYDPSNPSFYRIDNHRTTLANQFLSWVGSSMTLYDIEEQYLVTTPPTVTKLMSSCSCNSTATHALAPAVETLFSGVRDTVATVVNVSTGNLTIYPMGISGGTALYELDCTMSTGGTPSSETHTCVAVEEFGSGNRIIATSLSLASLTGSEDSVGMAHVPGIGGMISRAISTA